MKRLDFALISPALLLASALSAQALTPGPADRARQWLTLVDDGNYKEVTEQLAPQARKTEVAALPTQRKPLGAMASRDLRAIVMTPTRPGLPKGDYAVVRYESKFAHKTGAVETVTLVMNKGDWSVLDYRVE
jgi:hypothetical protein